MYVINLATGIVTRSSDGKQVAPVSDPSDFDYQTYVTWVAQGNKPTEVNVPLSPVGRKITKLAFRNRFTATEKISLELLSLDNPQAPMEQRQIAAALRVYLKDADNAKYIDLARADTEAGVNRLAALGVLTVDRAAHILNDPIQPEEAWEA